VEIDELLSKAQDSISVRRVYAEPVEKDGITVIPAARVSGGGGGGGGQDQNGQQGQGGGFGVNARPAGVYVIREGQVSWRPAVDPNRVIATVGAVLVALIVVRALRRRVVAGP
jgi:uncharacterized spore protein YtfJ